MAGAKLNADFWISEYHTPWDVYLHGVDRILATGKSPYQTFQVVDSGAYGKSLILDGKWQSAVGDEFLYHEPLVHPACCFQGGPRKVLILGGAEGATLREVLRWKTVERVVMVDIDGMVVEACRQHLAEMHQNSFADPRAAVMIGDALAFLQETEEQWDVIIADLTDPIESGPAFRLFTQEHFQRIKTVLAPGGFYVLQGGSLTPPELPIHAKVVNTLKTVFQQVNPCFCYAPTYGVSLGLVLAADRDFSTRPEPEAIDRLLQSSTTGGFRMFDGESLLGMLQLPLYVRRAIEAETEVYTLQHPPQAFGEGSMDERSMA